MDAPVFPLFRLPYVAVILVIEQMSISSIIKLSLLSRFAKRRVLRVTKKTIISSVFIDLDNSNSVDFIVKRPCAHDLIVFLRNPRNKMCQLHERSAIRKFFNVFSELFQNFDVQLKLSDGYKKYDMHCIEDTFKDSNMSLNVNSEFCLQGSHSISNLLSRSNFVSFENSAIVEHSSRRSLHHALTQRFNTVILRIDVPIRTLFSLQCENFLLLNHKFSCTVFSQFLKNWVAGRNRRLKNFVTFLNGNRDHSITQILKGITHQVIPNDVERKFFLFDFVANEHFPYTVAGGIDIISEFGKTATIFDGDMFNFHVHIWETVATA